jgi:menaquinone-dependent protoporphyrinogen IX oxidase
MAPRILVVYFSRSGTTRKLAEVIATELSADVEEIVDPTPRQGFVGYWRSLIQVRRRLPAGILQAKLVPSSYDLVVVGTPVWAWSVSPPVRAYLLAHKSSFPDLAFFCTMGRSGGERALQQMQQLAGKVPRATLAVQARDVVANTYAESLAEFLKVAKSTSSGPR